MSKLIQSLPMYYLESKVMKELIKPFDLENEILLNIIFDYINQFFVNTATFSLPKYEFEYGLPINPDLPISERRSRIMAKMKTTGTTTVQKIKTVITSWSDYEADVFEKTENDYEVKIVFTDFVGVPSNMQDVKKAINEIIPAHLVVNFVFKFNTYKDLTPFTNEELSSKTHYQLRNEKI